MKYSQTCPKCGGQDLRNREVSMSTSSLNKSNYVFESYICVNCKYTEFYLKFAGV